MMARRAIGLPRLFKVFELFPQVVLVTSLAIAPSTVHAAMPTTPQSSGDTPADTTDEISIREAAQEVTGAYVEEQNRLLAAEWESRRQAGMSLREWRERSPRESVAARVARRERPNLIRTLDEFGRADPADDWIVGQRVGFRILHGLYRDALGVAQGCRASQFWCAQLTGLIHQIDGELAAADSAFVVALEAAPQDHACEMRDISALLDDATAERYRSMECEERRALEERFWWLADPLHLQPVNHRWSEHWARATAIRIHDQLLKLTGLACTSYHREMVMKTGWRDHWWSHTGYWGTPLHGPGYAFAPHAEALVDPLNVSAEDWDLEPASTSLTQAERYDHPNGPAHHIDHQVAFFRRGDSAHVVAAVDLRDSPLAVSGTLDAGLVLTRDEHDPGVTVRESGLESRYLFQATAPAERHLVSVEVIAERGGFGRARFGDGLPEQSSGGLAFSSVLMLEGGVSVEEEELGAVVPLALGTTRVPSGESVGLYWEVYGLEAEDELELSIRVQSEESPGFFSRLAGALRLGGGGDPATTLRWQEPLETDGIHGRVLDFDISGLDPGEYTIELEGRSGGGGTAVVRRRFEVISAGPG